MNLGALLADFAVSQPIEYALRHGVSTMTWAELDQLRGRFAVLFDRLGIPPRATVGLVARNHIGAAAALLAIIAEDRCAVLINPLRPVAERAAEIDALGLFAIVAEPGDRDATIGDFAARGGPVIEVSSDGRSLESSRSGAGPGGRLAGPDASVEIQTSGTTGVPKRIAVMGSILEHNSSKAADGIWGVRRPGEAAQAAAGSFVFAPLGHASGIGHLIMSFYAGLPAILFDKFSVDQLGAALRLYRPNSISLAPAMLRMVLDSNLGPEDFASLESLRCGTAALDADAQQAFETRFGIPVLTNYGATEFLAAIANWTLADHAAFAAAKRGSVGRAAAGIEIGIVDQETGAPTPADGIGLLEVRALGAGEWVRTNDLASIDTDGFLFLHGRADNAIVRGGFKILPSRIEDILRRCPGVADVAVIPLPDPRLGQAPAAAVELKAGAQLSEDELRIFAREHLSAFEAPVRYVIAEALPRTHSAKIALVDLPALFADAAKI